jgi:hypothetical protein
LKAAPPKGPALPQADRAIIDSRKLTEYVLNTKHAVGGNKARVFQSVLGFTKDDADTLAAQLREGVTKYPAVKGKTDRFGVRYTVDIPVTGRHGSGIVRTGWIYQLGSDASMLTTAFVK